MKTATADNPIYPPSDVVVQRTINLSHIRKILPMINGDAGLARAAFEHLTTSQRRLVLTASGLSLNLTDRRCLSDYQIKRIRIGIKRLQHISNAFSACDSVDFQAAGQTQRRRQRETESAKLNMLRHVQPIKKFVLRKLQRITRARSYYERYKNSKWSDEQTIMALAKITHSDGWQNRLKRQRC